MPDKRFDPLLDFFIYLISPIEINKMIFSRNEEKICQKSEPDLHPAQREGCM